VITVSCHALLEDFSGFETEFGAKGAGTTTLTYDSLQVEPSIAMDVTALVQPIVSNLVTNRGFVIMTSDETVDLDFVVFASTRDRDTDSAPRLTLMYTVPPPPSYRRD
jgi:hypothetical protein